MFKWQNLNQTWPCRSFTVNLLLCEMVLGIFSLLPNVHVRHHTVMCAGGLLPNEPDYDTSSSFWYDVIQKPKTAAKNSSYAKASCVPYVQLSGQFWTHKDQPVPLSPQPGQILTCAINPLAFPHGFTWLTFFNNRTFSCKEITNQC